MSTGTDTRTQYDTLAAQSNEQYRLAGIALRTGDYAEYRRLTASVWALIDEAKPLYDQLSDRERRELAQQALLNMATAFARLGR